MRANFRLCQTFVWLGILVSLATCATEATAAILNVSTTAQLASAIANAQPGDTIVLAPGVYQPSARLDVLVDMRIEGDPSAPSIIDGGGHGILTARANDVRVANLTFRNGSTAISLDSRGTLDLRGVTITGNTGQGVTSDSGTVRIVNSTIAGNATGLEVSCATLTLRHVTISGNERGLHINFPCGEAFAVHNALIAGNEQDCLARGDYTLTGETSFDSDGTCRAAQTGAGTFTTVVNPGLGPLADNGGPTMTMALAASSPMVDTGSLCSEGLDQRAAIRSDGSCDVGAFERASFVSMVSATGAGIVRLRTSAGTFLRFHPVAEADMPNQAGKPPGVTFPFGFFEWSISLPAAGGSADVEILFPPGVPAPTEYWKVINTQWMNLCAHVPCAVNGNTLTISLFDGGIGDLDGIGNAVIRDPGGPGISDSGTVTFGTCLLYDPTKGKKSGSTYPIKLQLCDADGRNVSSPSIVLHAISVTRTSSSEVGTLDDSGSANPDFDFRYDASLGGYIFNLKTTGLATGTYNLNFTAGSDPIVHSAPFAVK